MLAIIQLLAEVGEVSPFADVASLLITATVSASVVASLITNLFQFLISRKNARITERRDSLDAESDVVLRYKEQAGEERAQKESAVRTIKDLLSESKQQVSALASTVETLTNTIKLLETLTTTQSTMIVQLTQDRDRTQEALNRAEARILLQKEQLRVTQMEIQNLIAQTRSRDEAARIVAESFNLSEDVVD